MLFNSYEFIFVFLPIVFFVYFYLNSKRLTVGAKGFLVFASLFFYSWWNVVYLPLILSSMLFNYVIGNSLAFDNKRGINKGFSKNTILTFGIVCNLALLGYFKYADFFILNLNLVTDIQVEPLNLLLPLAISFFTFQQIAYLVDSYRDETKEYDFLNYALFVTFFPQLIAGPIVHHKEMMPQFASKWNLVKNYRNIALGLFIFSLGLFKKVVIADTFAEWATNGFDRAVTLNLVEAWATSLSYTFQLYFDFSGYTDMAIGIALLFNIKLPINFNSPYKALDIQDFWRRWHITLSRFLRDYIYIPLGGNRKGNFRTYVNLMATFVIGGLWHGAGWTFVFWGFLHGVALCIHRVWQSIGFRLPKVIAWFITFNFVNIAWIFFRAKEWDDAVKVLSSMFSLDNVNFYTYKISSLLVSINGNDKTLGLSVFAFILVLYFNNSMYYYNNNFDKNRKSSLLTSFLLSYAVIEVHRVSVFLYFNF
ncbi:MBOAT family O-acyltransferase [Halarcobacter ebronensis]|uniref:Membrane-bound O-acyltransferase family protein n=1 Tax=Halarcobacter ebronensis TaxID=1462615 RepID=A0A4Q1ANI1_9BACT|nr:MBOAT family protein [Halarcobacter ebronensis]QKF82560.1 membrane-bound O-acyl transferase, MBOAT family [Halarcobacter ebronensis]RXK07427.1 membrane-bound O-acyltransferase family protein [Halarcobacter ebronensis]